jgi:hypothetical protein
LSLLSASLLPNVALTIVVWCVNQPSYMTRIVVQQNVMEECMCECVCLQYVERLLVSAYCICKLSVEGVVRHWRRVAENILSASCLECVSTTLHRGRRCYFTSKWPSQLYVCVSRPKERTKDRRYRFRIVKRYCVEVSCHYCFENGRVDVGPSLQEKDGRSGCLRTEQWC